MISKLKTSEWFLILLLVVSPLYFHNNLGGTGLRIPNNIFIWLIASGFISWSLYTLTQQAKISLPKGTLFLLAFPIIAWFNSICAGVEIFNQWLFRMLFIWGGVFYFFALFQQRFKQSHWDRLLFFILFAGLLHSLMGLAQIVFVKDIPNWLPINTSGDPTGFFQQINNQASFQVTVILIIMWLNTRPTILLANKWRFYFSLLVLGLSSFIVAYSGSRVGTLSFLIAAPLLIISRFKYIKLHYKKWLLILTTLVIAISSANSIEQRRGLMSVAQKTAAIDAGYSASARLGIYSIALDLIKEQPIWGHGIGSFVRVWQYKKPAFYEQHPDATLPSQRVSHPHNELMFWLVEGGLFAGLGLLVFFLTVLIALLKLPHSRRYAYMALLVPISLHTQVELPFYISSLHWFLFLTLLALVLSPYKTSITLNISYAAQKSIKLLSIGFLLATTFFFIHSYQASLELKKFVLTKDVNFDSMSTALNNAYFEELTTNLLMFSMFHTSIKKEITSNVRLVEDWAEQTISFDPHPNFFRIAIDANIYLKNSQKACDIVKTAKAMYPDNDRFQTVEKACLEQGITPSPAIQKSSSP